MTFNKIIEEVKNHTYYPVYFLYGIESYFIDSITKSLEKNVLSEEEKAFNQVILYGKETSVEQIFSYLYKLPMNAPYNLVIVKEAQHVNKLIDKLATYLATPAEKTILVINYKSKTVDNRKSGVKALKSKAVFFESKSPYDNQIATFINDFLKPKGITIEHKAVRLLVDSLGLDLTKITKELEKLILNITAQSKSNIDSSHVAEYIGISIDYNSFELNKALSVNNKPKALEIIYYLAANPSKFSFGGIINTLNNFFINVLKYHYAPDKSRNNISRVIGISPFFVTEYENAAKHYSIKKTVTCIELLFEYELKLKGVNNNKFSTAELLKELIIKLLNAEKVRPLYN